MKLRKSVNEDINNIIQIIDEAKEALKEQGIDQWQNGYPNADVIRNDILNNDSYVFIKNNEIVATSAVSFDGEKTYDKIYDGNWISNDEFAVIHRIAISNKYKGTGIASEIIKMIEAICLDKNVHSIKVDTHEFNMPMQKLLKKNDFKYCGVIYLEDKSKRVAFEKIF
ncbi:MAG: GNAT family N-acetyltransferase [Clostridium baratii]|uniref:GNAT family N-acetyltransferase n=1 Tax=Clostridium baratii TaxID=1561 RepID=UPI00242CC083|nr:GNAT family N-acetyltransferase [Clostridium baratii]MBS6007607.1 GNAT family N-acetyltransferase [Clostridium baratii]MDU1054384.1 GNAT family N-acetyltransferase [Clostridium baratii]